MGASVLPAVAVDVAVEAATSEQLHDVHHVVDLREYQELLG
jgi:hypothetical protein